MTAPARPRGPVERLRGVNRTLLLAVAAVVVVGLALGGYGAVRWLTGPSSPGDVTFAAGSASTSTGASQFCDVQVDDCGADPTASAVLRVPAGTPLQMTVPDEVAATPWQVAFTFRDATGVQQQGRSEVFAPHTRGAYTLVLPQAPGAPSPQLESAEVQQFGARLAETPQGLQFTTRATWVLSVDDR